MEEGEDWRARRRARRRRRRTRRMRRRRWGMKRRREFLICSENGLIRREKTVPNYHSSMMNGRREGGRKGGMEGKR